MTGTDLHERFDAWLRTGAPEDPPRDAAIHASVCDECLRKVAALDSLATVDLGAAPLPPSLGIARPARPMRRPAFAMGAVVVMAVAVATGAIAAPLLLRHRGAAEQQVQAATGTPVPSARRSVSLVPGGVSPPTMTATPTAAAPSSAEEMSPRPTAFRTTAPGSVAPTRTPAASPRPTTAVTPTLAATATPIATPLETVVSTPTASPTPAPTAVPDDCADGVDNDGDGAIDLLDPGCTLGTYEAFANPP